MRRVGTIHPCGTNVGYRTLLKWNRSLGTRSEKVKKKRHVWCHFYAVRYQALRTTLTSLQRTWGRIAVQTLNPQPSTLNPQPSTLNPQPSTLNPKP